MKKYTLVLFIVLFTSDSLLACVESLMPSHSESIRDLAPSSYDMLSRASIIAHISKSPTVNTDHVTLAALTMVLSQNEKINQLNDTYIIGSTPTLNTLSLVLKELCTLKEVAHQSGGIQCLSLKESNILKEVQKFLLDRLGFRDNHFGNDLGLFELMANGSLIAYLWDESFIPEPVYNQNVMSLFQRALVQKEIEIRYMQTQGHPDFSIPIFPEHFFLAVLRMRDAPLSDFLSELLDHTPIEIIDDLSLKINQARQTLSNS